MFAQKEVEIGGKKLLIETGRFAKQANGSVMVRYGDTMVCWLQLFLPLQELS